MNWQNVTDVMWKIGRYWAFKKLFLSGFAVKYLIVMEKKEDTDVMNEDDFISSFYCEFATAQRRGTKAPGSDGVFFWEERRN